MKNDILAWGLSVALCGLCLARACAGVIPGTGATPSRAVLGATDAVGYAVNEGGIGHALVVPYFSTQNGQGSLLHLVNTDPANGKAVKLRYRGAGNGDTLFDLTLLLSPGDVWTGIVVTQADGRANLVTADRSCTYPRIIPEGEARPFSTARLNPAWPSDLLANNTREGYVEAIVMADIPAAAAYGAGGDAPSALYTAIKQVNQSQGPLRPPCTAAALDAALLADTSDEATAASRGFATPTGGLLGTWYIIDVASAATFSGAATAFQAVNASGRPARGNYVVFPQTADPVAAPERFTADPLLVSAGLASRAKDADGNTASPTAATVVTAQSTDLPDLSTPYYLPAGELNARATAGDLSRMLAATSVTNQYATDPSISAKTDWVLSMPTRRYSVAYDYSQAGAAMARVFSVVPPAAPGNQHFHAGNTTVEPGQAQVCGSYGSRTFFDRESAGTFMGPALFMSPPDPLPVCGAVGILTFRDTANSALSSSITRQTLDRGLSTHGWSRIDSSAPGLPVLGASFIKLTNPGARPGVSGNYGITWPHMFGR